jgi:hypothetical protein
VLGSDAPVNGLQEVQLAGQLVCSRIPLGYVVVGFAVVVHWASFLGCGVVIAARCP